MICEEILSIEEYCADRLQKTAGFFVVNLQKCFQNR